MIFSFLSISANTLNPATATTDVNFGPFDIAAYVTMSGFFMFESAGTGFAGVAEYIKVDPATGQRTRVDLAQGSFQCTPVFSDLNVDTVTFLVGTTDENESTVQATGQIMIRRPDGTLL